jgi:hypothetical protein
MAQNYSVYSPYRFLESKLLNNSKSHENNTAVSIMQTPTPR